jgi:hypothetical protein
VKSMNWLPPQRVNQSDITRMASGQPWASSRS